MDRTEQILEDNLWLLPFETQRALRHAEGQPEVAIQSADGGLKASIKTQEERWIPLPSQSEVGATIERLSLNGVTPPLIIVVGLGLGYLLDVLERRRASTRVLAIEPLRSLTRAMLARRDWDEWLQTGRLTLLVGPDYPDREDVTRLLAHADGIPPVIVAPLLQREFPDETAGAAALLRQIIASLPKPQRQAS